jgi:peptidoglycan hydrolase-like protein with peptidoglycan-binding domain
MGVISSIFNNKAPVLGTAAAALTSLSGVQANTLRSDSATELSYLKLIPASQLSENPFSKPNETVLKALTPAEPFIPPTLKRPAEIATSPSPEKPHSNTPAKTEPKQLATAINLNSESPVVALLRVALSQNPKNIVQNLSRRFDSDFQTTLTDFRLKHDRSAAQQTEIGIHAAVAAAKQLVDSALLTFGQKNPAVGALQEILIQRGSLKIKKATNYFGDLTKEALAKEQTKLGLSDTGELNAATALALLFPIGEQLITNGSKNTELLKSLQNFVALNNPSGAYTLNREGNLIYLKGTSQGYAPNSKGIIQGAVASGFGYSDKYDSKRGSLLVDPKGVGINTNNKTVVGASLPVGYVKALAKQAGIKNPEVIDSKEMLAFLRAIRIEATNPNTGKSTIMPLVDLGPKDWEKRKGERIGNVVASHIENNGHNGVVDLTFGAAKALGFITDTYAGFSDNFMRKINFRVITPQAQVAKLEATSAK